MIRFFGLDRRIDPELDDKENRNQDPMGPLSVSRMVCILMVGLTCFGCGAKQSSTDRGVKAKLISIKPMTGNKVKLLLKVTNATGKDIVRAKARIDVLDDQGKSIGAKSTYLIHGAKGGLTAGESIEEDAFIEVSDNTKAKSMSFEIESIRFQE